MYDNTADEIEFATILKDLWGVNLGIWVSGKPISYIPAPVLLSRNLCFRYGAHAIFNSWVLILVTNDRRELILAI